MAEEVDGMQIEAEEGRQQVDEVVEHNVLSEEGNEDGKTEEIPQRSRRKS